MATSTLSLNEIRSGSESQFQEYINEFDADEVSDLGHAINDFNPACELKDLKVAYLLTMEVPGMKSSDIKVDYVDNTLTVEGERLHDDTLGDVKLSERHYGRFQRSFSLPLPVQVEKIKMSLENGILSVLIPRLEETQSQKIM